MTLAACARFPPPSVALEPTILVAPKLDAQELDAAELAVHVRQLRVALFADAECRSVPDWESILRHDIEAVSRIALRPAGIALSVVAVEPWNSGASVADELELWQRADDEIRRSGSDLNMFVSGKRIAPPDMNPGHGGGLAVPFGDRILVYMDAADWGSNARRETIAHELGHVFGAWHTLDELSVMRRYFSRAEVLEFDSVSIAVMKLFRGARLSRTEPDVPESSLSEYVRLFREHHLSGEWNPVSESLVMAAQRSERLGLSSAATTTAQMRRALVVARACHVDEPEVLSDIVTRARAMMARAIPCQQWR